MTPKTTKLPESGINVLLKLKVTEPTHVRVIVNASSFLINWGDGQSDRTSSHDYAQSGEYIVLIGANNMSKIKFNSCFCTEAYFRDCQQLRAIDCADNPLQTLKIADSFNLLSLNCPYCLLKELDLSTLRSLSWLNCSSNNLTEINLAGKQKLTVLDISNNELEELDISGCEDIVSVNLENNQLSVIALNEIFRHLDKYPPNSNAYINFYGNPGELSCNTSILEVKGWKTGDITETLNKKKPKLIQNIIVENNMSAMESHIKLTFCIKEKTDIIINTSAQYTLFVWSATETTSSPVAKCTFNPIGENQMKEVHIFAEGLESLYIGDMPLTDIVIESATLKCLGLINTPIDNLDLSKTPELEIMEVTGSRLKQLDLSPCKKLNSVACNNNKLQSITVRELAQMGSLDCSYNQLKQLDISGCKKINSLDFQHNKIPRIKMKDCPSLRHIHCDHNNIMNFDDLINQLPITAFTQVGTANVELFAGTITFSNNPGSESVNRELLAKKHWIETLTEY